MQIRRSALALVAAAALGGLTACGTSVETAQCDLASTALNAGQLATAAELYARAQQSGEGTCADTGLDAVGNRYASAFRESARGTALEVVADEAGARAAYQSALALDQNNQPAMNGLARLGTPQEQRVTSLALPAVAPYPQASWWTGWPIVLPTFLLALAALVFGGLLRRRAPSPGGPWLTQRHAPTPGTSWLRRRGRRTAEPEDGADGDDVEDRLDDRRDAEPRGRSAQAEPRAAEPPTAEPRPTEPPSPRPAPPRDTTPRPVTDHEARTDPVTVVTPLPRRSGLDLGRNDDPPGGRSPRSDPEDDPDRGDRRLAVVPPPIDGEAADREAAAPEATTPEPRPAGSGERGPGDPERDTNSSAQPTPTPTPDATTEPTPAPVSPEPAGSAHQAPAQQAPPPPDPALLVHAGEIGQLQRLLDRSVRTDDRPLPQRFFASGVAVPGAAVGVTLAVCDVGLTGGESDSRRLLCVQRLVVAAIPDGAWTPATGVDWIPAVRVDVAERAVGTIVDGDHRIWSTDPVSDERGLLRLIDAARPAWTALLRGEEPPGLWNPPTSAGSAALQAAFEGREAVVSPGPRPAGVRVVALVDALLADAPDGPTVVNARVEAQHHEMLAVAAAESIEFGLAAELVDLQKRGSNP